MFRKSKLKIANSNLIKTAEGIFHKRDNQYHTYRITPNNSIEIMLNFVGNFKQNKKTTHEQSSQF
jgi:hypothetical protein